MRKKVKHPEPDYSSGCTAMGPEELEDIFPQPHVRFYPNSHCKRCVRITLTRYPGIGVHYHVRICEEHNPVWDGRYDKFHPKDGCWFTSYSDEAGKGRFFSRQCNTVEEAQRYTQRTLHRAFPSRTHWYDSDVTGEVALDSKWFYGEGD